MMGIEPEMEAKLASIGFRESTSPFGMGIGMCLRVEQVEITAVESPLGLHLTFAAHGKRNHAQYEVQVNRTTSAEEIANLIVTNLSSNLEQFMLSERGGQ